MGCTKFGKNVTVKGRVLNPITGVGLADIKLNLRRGTVASFNGGYKTVKSTTTDANGYFEINKLGLSSYDIQADISTDLYGLGWFENGEKTGFTSIEVRVKKGKTKNVDYHAVEYGDLTINFKNTSCINANDKVQLFFDGEQIDSKTWLPGMLTELSGCIDIPGQPIKVTMANKYFHWVVTKNSITNTFYDTIFIQPNSNNILQINY